MRKKDRSYRQKRADDLMDEGDKVRLDEERRTAGAKRQQNYYTVFLHKEQPSTRRFAPHRPSQIVKLATKTPASSSTKTPYLKAADCFTDALFFEMDLPAAHASRANCWKHLDRYTLAYVDLSQAILKHSNPIPASYFASRAGILLHLKRYNDSLADLDDAIEINDVNPHAYYNRAVLLSEHTSPLNFDMALSDLNRAVLLMEKTMRIKLKKQGIVDTAVLNDSPVSFKVLHMAGSTEQQTDVKFVFKLRLLRGDIQRKKGLFQEALVDLREAASLDVTSGVAWNLLGQCNYATGLALEAEKCFTNAVDIDGENPLYYFDRGNTMLLVHEKKHKNEADLSDNDFLNNAVEDFTVATNLQTDREEYEEGESSPNPIVLQKLRYDRAEFHNGLAKACLAFEDEKHNTDALKSITVALEIQPKNHTFLFTSGMSYLALSDTKEAFSRFMKALKIFPEYCPALYQSALIFQDRKDYLIAYDNLTKCIACNNTGTKEEAVYFTRGLVLFDDGKLFDAQVDFKKALQLGSKRVDVYFYLGEAKRRSGDCVRALADFSVVEKLGKNSEIIESGRYRYARGISLSVIGDLENGLKDLVLAVDTDPHNTDYISAKADILARLGRFKEAEQVLRAGVDIALKTKAANTWSLLRKLSIALFKQDKHDESSKTMHRALLNSSQSMSPIEIADIYYKRGICLAHLKKHQRSYEMFDKALEVKEIHERPERILYTHERAKAAQMCGKHQDAITDFSVVTKMSPSDDRAFFRRAWSYKALGLFLLAAEDFETAVSLKPENKVYKLNYRAIGSIETIVLVPPGLEEIPKQIQDDWLASVIDPFVS